MFRQNCSLALCLVGSAVIMAVLPHPAFANTAAGTLAQQQIDDVVSAFQSATGKWFGTFQGYAENLFYLIAIIEFGWGSSQLLLRGGDLGAWTVHLIRSGVSIGVFYAILENYQTWGSDVINGLRQAAGQATGTTAITPGNVIIDGFNVMATAMSNIHAGGAGTIASDIGLVLAGIITVVVFALIAAQMALVLIESYFALNAGVLLVGLAPAPWSNSYAMNAMRWVIATGMKLFVMELIVGVGQSMIEGFAASNGTGDGESLFVIVAVAVMLLALVQKLPDYAAALISGHHNSSGSGFLTAAAAVGGALASGGASAMGASMAGKEAWSAAGALGVGGGGDGSSGGGENAGGSGADAGSFGGGNEASKADGAKPPGFASRVAKASGILASHVGKDIGAKVAGIPGSQAGTMGGRMAVRIRAENPDPAPPPPS